MFISCNLAILILALTLEGQVRGGEIIGGKETKHIRPYMVLVEQHIEGDPKTAHCGGFLLNDEFVMTAAHCQASSYKVFLGLHSYHRRNEAQSVSVEKTFIYQLYNETGYKNDLMLLKLSSKVVFTEKVKPIALAEQCVSQPKSCMIFGWGKTNHSNNHLSPNLMEGSVTLLDNEQCPRENSYCSKGEVGPGKGDSGGPLVCEDGKAYGIVSANLGPDSSCPMMHAYVKIPDYRTWIDSIIKNP